MVVKIVNVLSRFFKRKKINLKKRTLLTYYSRYYSRYVKDIDPLPTRYGGKTNVTILPGSGVGPELMDCALEVLRAAGAPLSYEILTLSSLNDTEEEFENALTSIRRNRVALKGNIEIQSKNPQDASRNILLRKTLDLYVYILSCKSYPGLANKFGNMDITVIRQNTEGEYLMLEHEPRPGSVESLKIVTRYNSERMAEFAFNYALQNNRKQITVVHNANIQMLTEGVFVEAAKAISKKYPSVKMNILEVRAAVIGLSKNLKSFDIILTTNLNGSMVSNYIIGMLGGPGLTCGINFSDNGIAVFEPGARSKGSSLVGKGIANPVAMILAGINLLNYLGYYKTAKTIEDSVSTTLQEDNIRTQDLGGKATSREVTERIIYHVKNFQKPKTEKKRDRREAQWKTYCHVPDDKFSNE